MPKSRHKILSRALAEAIASNRAEASVPPPFVSPYTKSPKTRADEIYDQIEKASYLVFADDEGRPWIERDCIEDCGEGVYLVRFRCPYLALYTRGGLNRVAERVCAALKSEVRYFCKERECRYVDGIVLRYYDCAWVICEGELSDIEEEVDWEDNNCESCIDTQEEIEGELTDESTAEEVDERFEKTLENFV